MKTNTKVIIAVLVLAGLGVAGYFIYKSVKKPKPVDDKKPVVDTNTQTTTPTIVDTLWDKMVKASGGKLSITKEIFATRVNSLTPKQQEIAGVMIDMMAGDKTAITKMTSYTKADVDAVNKAMKG